MTPSHSSLTALLLAATQPNPNVGLGFLHPQVSTNLHVSVVDWASCLVAPRRTSTVCFMASDDGDDDDDDSIDPNSLGDWRAFRMNLANAGLSSPGSLTIDGIELDENTNDPSSSMSVATSASSDATPSDSVELSTRRPKSVSKKNEQLLGSQNAKLAEEYLTGAWAHESAVPEVGGLVCRMPLEAEIYHGGSGSDITRKLHSFLNSEEYDRTEDSVPASTGGATSASATNVTTTGAISTSKKDSAISVGDDEDDYEDPSSSFSALAAKTAFWYRGAQKFLKRELVKITSQAGPNGRIEANDLEESSLELLQMYTENRKNWQSVCLVMERDERRGTAKTVTINRPMAFKLSESMGRLVLLGAFHSEIGGGSVNRRERNGGETQNLVKFLGAFENECGVYVGGQDDMDKPAVMIHGIEDLPGAVEISPGTGIYRGGIEAAMDGVLSGKYQPLDFRFFIGYTNYVGGQLDKAVGSGKYQPVACSRPLVLKQCIQLPKPLWHEVLEFCGGELKEISKLEFAKRDDLR